MRFLRTTSRLLAVLLMGGTWGASRCSADEPDVDFNRHIRPVLSANCFRCHGPDEAEREAGLRLDQREAATAELESGEVAVVPGKPQTSELVRRINSTEPSEKMPPEEVDKTLTSEEKELLTRWIAAGAPYDLHWSFAAPKQPPLPSVRNTSWCRHAIDRFVLASLEAHDLTPSAEADRVTLARRLSFDLRGLPPTPQEIDQFLTDDSADAYERLVDRMLESPHTAEKLTMQWLDLAHYGDTNGYHQDSHRDMWLYRDWLIHAFQTNQPFDQFVVEQIAGDLLASATAEQKIASGFNRNNTFNEEGGADPDEFYVAYAVDRTNTTGQVLLGLTVGCAQCHSHKYDPISQKEYYQLYAFFNSIAGEVGAGGEKGYHKKPLPPLFRANSPLRQGSDPAAEIKTQIAAARSRLADEWARQQSAQPDGEVLNAMKLWEAGLGDRAAAVELPVRDGLVLWLDAADINGNGIADHSEQPPLPAVVTKWIDRSGQGNHGHATGVPKHHPTSPIDEASGLLNSRATVELDGDEDFVRTDRGGEKLGGDFTAFVVFQTTRPHGNQMLVMWGEEAQGKRRGLWKTADPHLLAFNGHSADVIGTANVQPGVASIGAIIKSGVDHHVRVVLNGHPVGEGRVPLVEYEKKAIMIGANNANQEKAAAYVAEVLIYNRALDDAQQATVGGYLAAKNGVTSAYDGVPQGVAKIASTPVEQRSDEQRRCLRQFYIRRVHEESRRKFEELEAELVLLEKRKDDALAQLASTMVMQTMPTRRPAFVLMRGDFQQPAQQVQPDVPAIFPSLDPAAPRNRLGLAQWLVRPDHPLVSRVRVNHLWKQIFGTGLVKTAGDFGVQGEPPSHPALLDWLAVEFIENGWDTRALLKQMVMSSTYRQSSALKDRIAEVDPTNRLLYRAPRFRLSAEEIRDMALAVSGLLHREIGGPSVRPYQPASYYADKLGHEWKESTGSALYRRGMYTYWRRTAPYPSFLVFDAPSRELCTLRRPRTNTPLQALVTMNDPVFVEAARVLGQRIMQKGGATTPERITFAFRRVLNRRPTQAEATALEQIFDQQLDVSTADRDAAEKLVANGQYPVEKTLDTAALAAWTNVASVLMNLDEAITRE